MFEDATFDSRGLAGRQVSRWMVFAFGVNVAIIAAIVAMPLIWPEGLPVRLLQREIEVPAPGRVAVAQSRASRPARATSRTLELYNPLLAPRQTPTQTSLSPVGAPPVVGDVGLGEGATGVPGGIGPGVVFDRQTPTVVHPAAPVRVTVTGGVSAGLLIAKVTPAYPVIAKTAGISGTVVLAASISKEGRIEGLRVVSGNRMLTGAAIEAVRQWRYRPYLLNGEPVAVETTVNVVFTLGR
jgi:protein TonB